MAGATVVPMRNTKSTRSTALTTPYEPTKREVASIRAQAARREKTLPAPRIKTEMQDNGACNISLDHPDLETGYLLLSEAVGTGSARFLTGLLDGIGGLAQKGNTIHAPTMDFVLSIIQGLKPRDEVEAMLGSQMAAIQIVSMRMANNLTLAQDLQRLDQYERALNRLTRTFAAQMEALKRYRSKGEQRVYVERVNVESGGQAVVGPVNQKEEG